MANKKLKFYFFGIQYPEASADHYQNLPGDVIANPLEEYRPINSSPYLIKNGGPFIEEGDLIKGVLIRDRVKELPFKHNHETGDISNLGLDADEGLGTKTHFIVDRNIDIIMLQSSGVNIGQWRKFIEINYGIELETPYVVNPRTFHHVQTMSHIKNIQVKVKQLRDIDNYVGPRSVLNPMVIARETGADTLEFKLTSNAGLVLATGRQLIQSYIRHDSDHVYSIKVEGRNEEEESNQIFDLVTNRLVETVEIPVTRNLNDVSSEVIFEHMLSIYREHENNFNTLYSWES